MEHSVLRLALHERPLAQEIRRRIGVDVRACYQCGRCTAGCPVAYAMDAGPHQIMRGLQLEQGDWVFSRNTYWLCASCITCTTRCPCEVDIARVMDALREMAWEQGVRPAAPTVKVFHQTFLEMVRRTGRMYEPGLIGLYNLRSGQLLAGLDLALPMVSRGKIDLLPRRYRGQEEVERIFRRAADREGQG